MPNIRPDTSHRGTETTSRVNSLSGHYSMELCDDRTTVM